MRRLRQANGAWSLVAVALVCCLHRDVAAQEGAVDFKALYEAAEYDKALTVLATLDTVEAQQYKALCLLALGLHDEARAAATVLVTSSPTFVPSSDDVPPRFVEIIATTRKSLLPTIARQLFAEGREQFAAKRTEDAIGRFNLVLKLLSDPDFVDQTAAQDLKTLAQGFIDLAKASAPLEPAPVKVVEVTPPPVSRAQPPLPAGSPAPSTTPKITQATVVDQRVPPIPAELMGRIGPVLIIALMIDAEGRVASATVQQSAHPLFDRLVQQAAREWRYKPATLNGVPVPSERVVTVQTR